MGGHRVVIVCALLAGWQLIWTTPSHAQALLRYGPFRLVPSLDFRGDYTDNVVLAPSGQKESDFLVVVSPGIGLTYTRPRQSAGLFYRADIQRYAENTNLDFVRHSARLDARAELGRRWKVSLENAFSHTDEFVGEPVPELTELVAHNENQLSAGAEYRFADRWALGLDYGFFLIDYQDPDFEDLNRQDHRVELDGFYYIMPRTAVFLGYAFQAVRYRQDDVASERDSETHSVFLGLRGEPTATTKVTARVGGAYRDFKGDRNDSFSDIVLRVDGDWFYRSPSKLRIFVARDLRESTVEGSDNFVATYGGVEVQHFLQPRLQVRFVGLVGLNDYVDSVTVGDVTARRDDYFYEISVALRYQFQRWLLFEATYRRRTRDSNFDLFDYTENRVQVAIRAQF